MAALDQLLLPLVTMFRPSCDLIEKMHQNVTPMHTGGINDYVK